MYFYMMILDLTDSDTSVKSVSDSLPTPTKLIVNLKSPCALSVMVVIIMAWSSLDEEAARKHRAKAKNVEIGSEVFKKLQSSLH